jgi:hypothetical protein
VEQDGSVDGHETLDELDRGRCGVHAGDRTGDIEHLVTSSGS